MVESLDRAACGRTCRRIKMGGKTTSRYGWCKDLRRIWPVTDTVLPIAGMDEKPVKHSLIGAALVVAFQQGLSCSACQSLAKYSAHCIYGIIRMKFRIGAVPEDYFEPDDTWHAIREPGPLLMQLFAFPIGFALLAAFVFLWQSYVAMGPILVPKEYSLLFGLAAIASLPLLILVHELLHAVAHPGYGLQSASIIGAWPKKLLFYAHYCGALKRNEFLLVFAMPFLIISVLPLVVAILGILPPPLATTAAWFSIWNALFACGDVIGFCFVLAQIPRNSIVQNKGWRTFGKHV